MKWFLGAVFVLSSISVSDALQNTLAEYGPQAKLTCCSKQKTSSELNCQWLKQNGDGLFPKICDSNGCKYGYSVDSTQGCSHLIINTTVSGVAGLFQCNEVSIEDKSGAYLVVYNFTCHANFSGKDDLVEDSHIMLQCSMSWRGKLPFDIHWIDSNGQIIKQENFTNPQELYQSFLTVVIKRPLLPACTVKFLFLKEGITDDSIDKYCPHINWTSPSAPVMYRVTNIRTSCPADDCRRKLGDSIQCSADGNPNPEFLWQDWDGKEIASGAVLWITEKQESQKFTCIAKNVIHGISHQIEQPVAVKLAEQKEAASRDWVLYLVGFVVLVVILVVMLVRQERGLKRQDTWRIEQDDLKRRIERLECSLPVSRVVTMRERRTNHKQKFQKNNDEYIEQELLAERPSLELEGTIVTQALDD